MIKKNIANFVTILRMIGTIVIIFLEPLSKPFYICFIFTGFTDVLDGFLARTLHIESEVGKKLDSISDVLFYVVTIIKIWPLLELSNFAWIFVFTIAGLRVLLYLYSFIRFHALLSNHTILNKATGFLLFFVPFAINTSYFEIYVIGLCVLSLVSVVYEATITIKK